VSSLPRISGREVVVALSKIGYKRDRQKGSHIVICEILRIYYKFGRIYAIMRI
jgi:hypothetical protein